MLKIQLCRQISPRNSGGSEFLNEHYPTRKNIPTTFRQPKIGGRELPPSLLLPPAMTPQAEWLTTTLEIQVLLIGLKCCCYCPKCPCCLARIMSARDQLQSSVLVELRNTIADARLSGIEISVQWLTF